MLVWYIIVSMNIAMGLSALFVWVQCIPVTKSWNPFADGTCWPPYVLVYYDIFSAGELCSFAGCVPLLHAKGPLVYSALMDFTLALLPWTLIWKLQMKPKEKAGVAIAMSMGILYAVLPALNHLHVSTADTLGSAGITAIVKTSKIPTMLSNDMCKSSPSGPPRRKI